jgi:hypothetical protein
MEVPIIHSSIPAATTFSVKNRLFFGSIGFELRASHLLGRATPLGLFFFVLSIFPDRVS